MIPAGADVVFAEDVPYTPQHEHQMMLILDDLAQQGRLEGSEGLVGIGDAILSALAGAGMLR